MPPRRRIYTPRNMTEVRTDPDLAFTAISRKVRPTRVEVQVAKSFILRSIFEGNYSDQGPGVRAEELVAAFLRYMDPSSTAEMVFQRLEDSDVFEGKTAHIARQVGWTATAGEALLECIHANLLMAMSEHISTLAHRVRYTQQQSPSSSTSSTWHFESFAVVVPTYVQIVPSVRDQGQEILADGDVFLSALNITEVHELVAEALGEAVQCFRHELYTPCLAMLLKAIEQAWIEMGMALADSLPARNSQAASKLRAALENPKVGLVGKIEQVTQIYDKRDLLGAIWERSQRDNRELRETAIWIDQVRDSRNVLHYGASAWVPNTYEKVAVLLLAAIPNFRNLHVITAAARAAIS